MRTPTVSHGRYGVQVGSNEVEPMGSLASRLRALRHRAGYSLTTAADIAGIHRQSLGRFERGEANPALDTLARLAAAYGFDDMARFLRGVRVEDCYGGNEGGRKSWKGKRR